MAGAAAKNVSNIKDAKPGQTKSKQTLFALKRGYVDAKKNRLTLFCKQQKDGSFKVWAIHQKAGSKKQRGMVSVYQQQPQAEAKFNEIVSQISGQRGWKETLVSSKSAFDVVPAAEE